MTTSVRRFNEQGLRLAALRLLDINAGLKTEVDDLLENEDLTERLSPEITIEKRMFASRRDAAEHLLKALKGLQWDVISNASGLWTWLALSWMEILVPEVDGKRELGEINRWLLAADDWNRYYRHLFAGPCYIYKAHEDNPDRANAVLCSSVLHPGEVVEQVASRLDLVRSPGIMEAITKLYYDEVNKKPKAGAASKKQGTARRLGPVLLQLDRTWDVQNLTAERVLALLPSEFDRFKPPAEIRPEAK